MRSTTVNVERTTYSAYNTSLARWHVTIQAHVNTPTASTVTSERACVCVLTGYGDGARGHGTRVGTRERQERAHTQLPCVTL
eukprot:2339340-Prymnesium_polylepis.1